MPRGSGKSYIDIISIIYNLPDYHPDFTYLACHIPRPAIGRASDKSSRSSSPMEWTGENDAQRSDGSQQHIASVGLEPVSPWPHIKDMLSVSAGFFVNQ